MFLKQFRIKSETLLKGSDRKKLRSDVGQQYKALSCAQIADLIPSKGSMKQLKNVAHSEEVFTVYFSEKNPIFFESFKKLYPTVYTLWRFPDILPVFVTYPPVLSKLLEGADLMLPGVEVQGEHHAKMFGTLQKGDLCVIRLKGNRAPVALGEALMSGEDMYMSAMRGKGVHPLHLYRDELWALGDTSHPPLLPDGSVDDAEDSDDSVDGEDSDGGVETVESSVECKEESIGEASNSESAEGVVPLMQQLNMGNQGGTSVGDLGQESVGGECRYPDLAAESEGRHDDGSEEEEKEDKVQAGDDTEEMDSLLEFCFKCAIKGRITKQDLPVLTSNLFKNFMQPFSSSKRLDLKKSSYKKFSKFLKHMENEGFIQVKQISRGVDAITEVNKFHQSLKCLEIPQLAAEETTQGDSVEDRFEPPEITDVLCVTADTLPLLEPLGFTKSSYLSTSQLRLIVTDYIKTNNLQPEGDKGKILLDPILAHIALTRSEGDKSYLDWATLFGRITNRMTAACLIQFPGKQPIMKKGKILPVRMTVEQRAAKKKMTLVHNLEAYGIDPRQFAQLIQRKVAGSANTFPSEQKGGGHDVQVQGSHAHTIYQFLLDTYKLPRKFVQQPEGKPGKR